MLSSMDKERPRVTQVLTEWELGVVLEALSKATNEPLWEGLSWAPYLQDSLPLSHGLSRKTQRASSSAIDLKYNAIQCTSVHLRVRALCSSIHL